MNEKNKKLAEWSGFESTTVYFDLGGGKSGNHLWLKNNLAYMDEELDFFNDLNACFKWLVPKLINANRWLGMITVDYSWGVQYTFAITEEDKTNIEFSDKEPAQALCGAILKLIEDK